MCISSESTSQYHVIGIVETDFKIRPHFITVLEYTIAIDLLLWEIQNHPAVQ